MRLTRAEFLRYLTTGLVAAPLRLHAAGMEPDVSSSGPDTPAITPTDRFYVEDINGPPGLEAIQKDRWHLTLDGKVHRPVTWSYPDLIRRSTAERTITLSCIGNPVGGYALGNAHWLGLPFRELLSEVQPGPTARFVLFQGLDGYHECLPLKKLDTPGALLATHMNGQVLNRAHGFPVRLLAPGLYGIKQVKWIQRIRFLENEETGYWKQRGWSQSAEVQVFSRIDFPQPGQWVERGTHEIKGIAFAGDRGIDYVQVSTDGEESWQLAQLEPPLSPWSWVFWKFPVAFNRVGRYSLSVRAADQFSQRQQGDRRDPFPNGVTGYHRIEVLAY